MSERDPGLKITIGNEEFEATPYNTTLFTFLGRIAIKDMEYDSSRFDHIFLQRGDVDSETISGAYIFKTSETLETFDAIKAHLESHSFPMMLNRRGVPECDVTAYFNMLDRYVASQEIPDSLEGMF